MNKTSLKNIFSICFLMVFLAFVCPIFFGGAIFTLQIEESHFYLWDHGKSTEVDPVTLLWLIGLAGAAVPALLVGAITGIMIIARNLKEEKMNRRVN